MKEGKTTDMTCGNPLRLVFLFALGVLFVLRYSMQALGHKVVPVLSSGIEFAMKIVFAFAIVPKLGYWGGVITEPVTWVMCAATLALVYITRGHQKEKNKIYQEDFYEKGT